MSLQYYLLLPYKGNVISAIDYRINYIKKIMTLPRENTQKYVVSTPIYLNQINLEKHIQCQIQ